MPLLSSANWNYKNAHVTTSEPPNIVPKLNTLRSLNLGSWYELSGEVPLGEPIREEHIANKRKSNHINTYKDLLRFNPICPTFFDFFTIFHKVQEPLPLPPFLFTILKEISLMIWNQFLYTINGYRVQCDCRYASILY